MLGSTDSALSGLNNASKHIQNSANNLANVLTSGFKKGEVNSVENKTGETRVNSISAVGNPNDRAFESGLSGFLEGFNVDIAEEIVDQIISKSTFKANINVIKSNDEMIGSLLDIKS